MFLKRRLAAFASLVAAVAIAAPVLSASAAPTPTDPVVEGPSCPEGYAGPTNLATGCPYWMMSYTVTYPGQPPIHCPVTWTPPPALPDAGAAAGSGVFQGCDGVPAL